MITHCRPVSVLGIALAVCVAWPADRPVGTGSAEDPKALADAIADDVRSECVNFMEAFQARRWLERKIPLSEGDIPEVEAHLLDALALSIELHPTVESVNVVHGERILTGERSYSSAADRCVGRRLRVGDMYSGPLQTLRYGRQLSAAERAAIVTVAQGGRRVYVDVPVVDGNRYVCGLLVTFRP